MFVRGKDVTTWSRICWSCLHLTKIASKFTITPFGNLISFHSELWLNRTESSKEKLHIFSVVYCKLLPVIPILSWLVSSGGMEYIEEQGVYDIVSTGSLTDSYNVLIYKTTSRHTHTHTHTHRYKQSNPSNNYMDM